jgi:hypothetical protein
MDLVQDQSRKAGHAMNLRLTAGGVRQGLSPKTDVRTLRLCRQCRSCLDTD